MRLALYFLPCERRHALPPPCFTPKASPQKHLCGALGCLGDDQLPRIVPRLPRGVTWSLFCVVVRGESMAWRHPQSSTNASTGAGADAREELESSEDEGNIKKAKEVHRQERLRATLAATAMYKGGTKTQKRNQRRRRKLALLELTTGAVHERGADRGPAVSLESRWCRCVACSGAPCS